MRIFKTVKRTLAMTFRIVLDTSRRLARIHVDRSS